MENKKLGIEEAKEAAIFLVAISEATIKMVTKESSPFAQIFKILSASKDVEKLTENIKLIPAQFDDMDEKERNEIQEAISAEFDLENKKLELVIEDSFSIALNAFGIVQDLRNLLPRWSEVFQAKAA